MLALRERRASVCIGIGEADTSREVGVGEGDIFYLLATKQQRFEQHFNAPTVKWNMSDMQIFTHLNKYWLQIQLRIW